MDRLTSDNGWLSCPTVWCHHECVAGGTVCHELKKAISKLSDYEDAEEQCLLLRLPCKVGDTVYEIMHTGCRDCAVFDHERYKSCHVRYGEFCGREEIRPIPFTLGCLDYMDKLVFLTREEAEMAIKEGTGNA